MDTDEHGLIMAQNSHHKHTIKDWVEMGGIIAGIIGVIFLVFQYREMVKATKATLKSIEVSKGQMDIMKRQLDDSEAQQRALLQFGQFNVTATITTNMGDPYYTLESSYTIKNIGYSPAIDLQGFGVEFDENDFTRMMDESAVKAGYTNQIKRWNHKQIPVSSPYNGDPFNGGTTVLIPPARNYNQWNFPDYECMVRRFSLYRTMD